MELGDTTRASATYTRIRVGGREAQLAVVVNQLAPHLLPLLLLAVLLDPCLELRTGVEDGQMIVHGARQAERVRCTLAEVRTYTGVGMGRGEGKRTGRAVGAGGLRGAAFIVYYYNMCNVAI